MRLRHRLAWSVGLAWLLAGCASHPPGHHGTSAQHHTGGGGYYENDGPPEDTHVDLSKIPDAVPKDVPPSAHANPTSYTALGKTYYVLKNAAGFTQTGRASWYGRQFAGHPTASGTPYDMFRMTAAHKRLPIPSWVRVTNLDNGKHVIVKINDRGPFHKGRIIDLSYVAARKLGIVADGSAPVRIRTVTPQTLQAGTNTAGRSDTPPVPLRHGNKRLEVSDTGATANNHRAPTTPTNHGQPPAANNGKSLFLQTGAFDNPKNARRLRARLDADGIAHVAILDPTQEMPLYRVQVGPFDNAARRNAARQRLITQGFAARSVER